MNATTTTMLSPWRWAAAMGKPGSFVFLYAGQILVANDLNNPEQAALAHVRRHLKTDARFQGLVLRTLAVRKV
jgi:hypothetical protein